MKKYIKPESCIIIVDMDSILQNTSSITRGKYTIPEDIPGEVEARGAENLVVDEW